MKVGRDDSSVLNAVTQLHSVFNARFGLGRRYAGFCSWAVGDHVRTRITTHWDGAKCQIWISDAAMHAPELLTEILAPEDLPKVLEQVRLCLKDRDRARGP